MRTRQTTNDGPVSVGRMVAYGGGPFSPASSITAYSTKSESKWMEDVVTSGYKRLRAEGQIIMSPCESIVTHVESPPSSCYYNLAYYTRANSSAPWVLHPSSYQMVTTGGYNGRAYSTRQPLATVSLSARIAYLSKFGTLPSNSEKQVILARALDKATSPEVLSLVTMAEMNKTLALFESAGGILNRMAALLEKLGPSGARELNAWLARVGRSSPKQRQLLLKALKQGLSEKSLTKGLVAAASAWLGYRYAIMTTIQDFSSWSGAIGGKPRRARQVAEQTWSWSHDPGEALTYSDHYQMFYERSVLRRATKISAGVLIDTAKLTEADVYGANRIASTAWELVPFSFVVDWFVDIGTRISALEGGLSVRPLGSWITTTHDLYESYGYRTAFRETITGNEKRTGTGAYEGSHEELNKWVVREVNPILSPIPRMSIRINAKRLADGLALIVQGGHRLRSASG